MRFKKSGFLFTIFFATTFLLYAQDTSFTLNPVTVTASVKPINVANTGRNLVVIKGDQFKNLPVNSIDELLRYVPGIEAQARGPMGSQTDFTLRGGTFQQVLVILDGLRLNDPNTGHFSSYIPIAPAEIERIEVLKGASSAIYGSDAVGGVIHIITKTFAAQQGMGKSKSLSAQVLAGQYGLFNSNIGGYYNNGKTAVAAGLLSNNATGQPLRGTRSFLNLHTASLSVNHHINKHWQLGVRTAYDSRRFNAQNYYTTSVADTANEKVETFWNQLQLVYQKEKNKVTISSGYKTVQDIFAFNSRVTPNNNKSKLFQNLITYQHSFNIKTTLITGGQFQNRSIQSNDRGNHNVKQAAAFALLQQAVGTAFNITPALRLDWDERSGTEWVPQLNVSYRITDFQLRGSVGKTIRQPDFTERYNNYNRPLVPSLNRLGNPDLAAEHSLSYELGADYFAGSYFRLSTTLFRRDYDNLIDYVRTPYSDVPRQSNLSPTGTYFLAQNIASLTTTGFEADMGFLKSLPAGRQLYATLGFITLRSVSANAQPSLYISGHAKLLTNFTALYSTPRWSFSVNGLYKQRNPQTAAAIKAEVSKDYFVLNTKAEAFIIKRKLSLVAQADNIFDRNFSDLLGAQMPGRWLMGGIKLAL